MRFVIATAVKDLKRLRRDPFSLIVALGIPLILGGLMNIVFGGRDPNPHGRVMIADEDRTFLSGVVAGTFRNGPLANMITVESVTRADGLARVNRGDGSALLIVPKGLQAAYLSNTPFRMELVTNPSERIMPKIVEESLSIMVEGLTVNRTGGNARRYLSPPLIGLDVTVTASRRPNFATLFFPSMIFMALLFIGNWLSADIWRERAFGTLRRIAASPASLEAFLAGRIVFVAVILFAVSIAALAAGRWAGMEESHAGLSTLWLMLSGVALFEMVLLAKLFASTERTANVLGNLVILPLAFLGGSFFPFEAMPDWMATIGRKTPNGWTLVQFKTILSGSGDIRELFAAFAVLTIASVVIFFIASRRLRRGFVL